LLFSARFQPTKIGFFKLRPVRGDGTEQAPQKLFSGNPEGQSFERLQQTKAVVGIRSANLHLADFLSDPCASLANTAFPSPQFADQSSKRFLISTDFCSQIAKELLEGISVVVFDQVIEQFQGGDGAGEMIVEISMEMTGGFGMGHNAVSNLMTGRVAFRGMFAPVQSALTMLERA